MTAAVEIVSFGFLHGPAPDAHLTVDLRAHFRDPHVSPGLRQMTATDLPVQHAVLHTSGIRPLISALADAAAAFRIGAPDIPLRLAIGCAGGRHRAPVVATEWASRASRGDGLIRLTHRDLTQPVVDGGR